MNPVSKKDFMNRYAAEGKTWENEIFASAYQSRNRAWLFSFMSMGIAISSIITLMMILPLKTFEPYIVTVDRSTGYVEVTKGLQAGSLTQDEAITQSNLVRYVSARESYNPNPAVLRDHYDFVALLSGGLALKEYQQLWDGENSDNPSIQLGHKASVDIKIQSVSFLNDRTASIRFLRELRKDNLLKTSTWNAIIDFQYVQKPMKMIDRFSNPLGFQITSYRINPEIMETTR